MWLVLLCVQLRQTGRRIFNKDSRAFPTCIVLVSLCKSCAHAHRPFSWSIKPCLPLHHYVMRCIIVPVHDGTAEVMSIICSHVFPAWIATLLACSHSNLPDGKRCHAHCYSANCSPCSHALERMRRSRTTLRSTDCPLSIRSEMTPCTSCLEKPMLATSSITCAHEKRNEPDVMWMHNEETNTVAALKRHPTCRHKNEIGLSSTHIPANLACMYRQGLL
jgi:hypothetical protein